ncbi:MAG: thioredoxin [Bacteroidales bacterium]|nr:thioredoxin [Bacteroidales bacterium]
MNTALIIAGTLLLVLLGYGIYNFRKFKNMEDVAPSERIRILSDKSFQHQIKKGVSLVDFWASWCVPCKMMSPVLNDVAEELDGSANVCKLNVEQYPNISSRYHIKGIPTMVLFRDGIEVNRFAGIKSKEFLIKQINLLI